VVVAVGVTVRDPEGPAAEKPVPLQVFAFVLLHMSVADWPLGTERAKAERVAVGAGAVAACATESADGFVDCETARTPCAATICWLSCPSADAGGERAVIGVAFDGELELGDEFAACPKTVSGKKNKPSLIVNAVKRTMCFLPAAAGNSTLTRRFWRSIVYARWL
jgi:hypothetical protein